MFINWLLTEYNMKVGRHLFVLNEMSESEMKRRYYTNAEDIKNKLSAVTCITADI